MEGLSPILSFQVGYSDDLQKGLVATFNFTVALGPVGHTFLVVNSKIIKESFKFLGSKGPLSLRTVSGKPCVPNMASMLYVTHLFSRVVPPLANVSSSL